MKRRPPMFTRILQGLHGSLTYLFPRGFRDRFGEEMRRAFMDGCHSAHRRHGTRGLVVFLLRELAQLPWAAAMEHLAEWEKGRRPQRSGVGHTSRDGKPSTPRGPRPRKGMGMETVFQDLRFAVRTFARRPGFTVVALLTLTLGIGAATAIFSVVNGVLLRPFPFPDADELVALWNTNPERGQDQYRMAGTDFFELERSASSFLGMALVAGATASLTGEDLPPMRVEGAAVSASLFRLLGVRPLMGRSFLPDENQDDHRVVILSRGLWTGRFGGDPRIVGKHITMDGAEVQVIGVMPGIPLPLGGGTLRLSGPDTPVYWTALDYTQSWVSEVGAHVMAVVARMKPDVTPARAQEEMAALARSMNEAAGGSSEGIIVRPLREQVVGDIRQDLLILMGAVGLLLLMACGNVANLLLARATDRERELAVRTAIGAGRGRLLRQVFTEVLLLGSVGGVLGLLLARWGTGALLVLVPSDLPRQSDIGVDGTVLLFAVASVLLSTLTAGLIPSLRMSGRDPERGLKAGGRCRAASRERNRATRAIVVFQFVLATVLLVGAGLLARTFQALRGVDPGFRSEGILTAQLVLPPSQYDVPARVLTFYDRLYEGLGSIPGVTSVVLSMDHPLQNNWWNGVTLLDQPPPPDGEGPIGIFRPVGVGYFRTYQIPVVEGRAFEPGDRIGVPGVMVVNESFVKKYFPGVHPLGERVRFIVGQAIWGREVPQDFEIVGVVGDVRFNGVREPSEPAFYVPLRQFPYQAIKVQLKTPGDPERLAPELNREIWRVDPNLPITDLRTMDQVLAEALARDRFNLILLGAFALAALILASAGIYGVLSYMVAQKTPELGIRLALGAEPAGVLQMVVADAIVMAGIGVGGGLAGAAILAPLLSSLLFGVPPHDPNVLAGVALVLGGAALGSGFLPALKAARADPMEVLRGE